MAASNAIDKDTDRAEKESTTPPATASQGELVEEKKTENDAGNAYFVRLQET
jgi:hypothetical protein